MFVGVNKCITDIDENMGLCPNSSYCLWCADRFGF